MVRKRTKMLRLRVKMLEGETRAERLRGTVSESEATFPKGNQHVDNYMCHKCPMSAVRLYN